MTVPPPSGKIVEDRAAEFRGARVRVGVGIARFPGEAPRDFWRWVELCETGPIDSLWQTDRLQSAEPFLESMTTMAAVAGATERIKFGMNAVVVPYRDPLVLAKQCATIDYLSGGRLLPVFGVGADVAPEWAATGRAPEQRGRRANEALEIMRRLWSEDVVSFSGEFYRYADARISPRPVQDPLPCWIGGASDAAIRRTARLGTGWLAGAQTPRQVAAVVAGIGRELAKADRSIDRDHYGASIAFRFGSSEDPQVAALVAARERRRAQSAPERSRASTETAADADAAGGRLDRHDTRDAIAIGGAREILERISAYRAAGASKFVLIPLARGTEDLLAQTRRLAQEVVPEAHAST